MHEQDRKMGSWSKKNGQPTQSRSTKRQDAQRTLVPHSPQHGAGLADTFKQPTGKECPPGSHGADMGRDSLARGSNLSNQEVSCPENPVASLGHRSSFRQKTLRPQGQKVKSTVRPRGPVNTKNVLRLLEFQNYRCALTGRKLTPDISSLDHIVPIRNGGEHVIENAQILHSDINRAKGSLSQDEFICLCTEVYKTHGCHK